MNRFQFLLHHAHHGTPNGAVVPAVSMLPHFMADTATCILEGPAALSDKALVGVRRFAHDARRTLDALSIRRLDLSLSPLLSDESREALRAALIADIRALRGSTVQQSRRPI